MIVRLNGGLGNQMFQYAFGKALLEERREQVFFYKFNLDNGNHRPYALGVFNTDIEFAEPTTVPLIYTEKTFALDETAFGKPSGTYFNGNWQTEKYFSKPVVKRIIRKQFTPKNPLSLPTVVWKMKILNETKVPTCSLHVRRTDYLIPSTIAYHGSVGMEYYNAAIEYIKSRIADAHFFVFSDDKDWCRQNFVGPEFSIVDANGMGNGTTGPSTEHEDLFLMSFCDHAIIPNSSFGWWGAWIGDQFAEEYGMERIVIAPKAWFNPIGPAQNLDTSDIIPERWVKL